MQVRPIELVLQINNVMKKKNITLISTIIVIITLFVQYLNNDGEYTIILYLLLILILILLIYSFLRNKKE